MENIREPAVAGAFYPSDPDVLSDDVMGYLQKSEKEAIEGDVIALISPMPVTHIPVRWPLTPISWWRGWISMTWWSLPPATGGPLKEPPFITEVGSGRL